MSKRKTLFFVMVASVIIQLCGGYKSPSLMLEDSPIAFSKKNQFGREEKRDDHVYDLDTESKYIDETPDSYEALADARFNQDFRSSAADSAGRILPQTALIENDTVTTNRSFSDSNENNDSFQEATSIYSAGTHEGGVYSHSVSLSATISQKTSGWWFLEQKYIDKDFYSFDMVSVGTLTIDLTEVPSTCDYDLRVYKLSNSVETSYTELDFNNPNHIFAQSKSGEIGDNEHIEIANALPGTYYIVVYSYQDTYFDNDNPYNLTVRELVNTTTRPNTSYSISQGRASGDLFALWKSDYAPLGIDTFSVTNENARVAYNNYSSYPMIRHLADKYTNGVNCNYAVLYVWDVNVRTYLHSYFYALLQSLNSQFFDPYGNEVDVNEDEKKIFSIVWNSAGVALASGPIGWALGAISLAMSIYSLVDSCIENKFVITKRQFRDYLINIVSALETGTGSNNNEVVMIKFQYRFYTENGTRYLDWSPVYDPSNGNRYNENTINYQIPGSGMDGTVRSFASASQINMFLGGC